MHFGVALGLSDTDLWNRDLLDTHLDFLDTDIPSKCFFVSIMSSIRLPDMSSRRLEDAFSVTIFGIWKRLQDVLEDVILLGWRRGEDAFETNKCFLGEVCLRYRILHNLISTTKL